MSQGPKVRVEGRPGQARHPGRAASHPEVPGTERWARDAASGCGSHRGPPAVQSAPAARCNRSPRRDHTHPAPPWEPSASSTAAGSPSTAAEKKTASGSSCRPSQLLPSVRPRPSPAAAAAARGWPRASPAAERLQVRGGRGGGRGRRGRSLRAPGRAGRGGGEAAARAQPAGCGRLGRGRWREAPPPEALGAPGSCAGERFSPPPSFRRRRRSARYCWASLINTGIPGEAR